jgi:hypothetical protein
MNALLAGWQRLCDDSAVLRFVDINLRGTVQVIFQDHPFTAALFIAAIAWDSFAAGAREVLFGGLLGLVTATLAAMWLRVDAEGLAAGLYGYNGILVGLALATFLAPSPQLWCYVGWLGREALRPRGVGFGNDPGAELLEQPLELGRVHDDLSGCGAQTIDGFVSQYERRGLLVQELEFGLVL